MRGSSRKYRNHAATQSSEAAPTATNEPRHPTQATSRNTSGGVIALPSRAQAWVMPCAQPDLPPGSQVDIAFVASGNVAPSPSPSSTRITSSDPNPPTAPVSIVANAHTAPQIVSVHRAPNRSPSHPPATWNSR